MEMMMVNTTVNLNDSFWSLTDLTKETEKYRIDKNLQYLQHASFKSLKKIFVQYRYFTHYYIADLALLISKMPFGQLKSVLGEILHEELGEGKAAGAHPQLYDDFLLSLGVSQAELNHQDRYCIANLQQIQNALITNNWAYGVGLRGMGGECLCQIYLSTMHDYFSKNPAIIKRDKQLAWTFWEIHIGEVDLHHQEIIRAAIDEVVQSQPETVNDLINGYEQSKQAWDNYWEQIFKLGKQYDNKRHTTAA